MKLNITKLNNVKLSDSILLKKGLLTLPKIISSLLTSIDNTKIVEPLEYSYDQLSNKYIYLEDAEKDTFLRGYLISLSHDYKDPFYASDIVKLLDYKFIINFSIDDYLSHLLIKEVKSINNKYNDLKL
jgi:hypothetical protein